MKNRPCGSLYGRLSGTYCSQVPIRPPIWERYPFRTDCQLTFQTRTMLPSRHKTTGLGAPSLRNCLSIKSLNLHNTPKSLQERRLESIRFQKKSFPKACKVFFQNILLPGNFISRNMAAPRIWLTQLPRRISGISRSAGTSVQSAGPASRRWIPTKSVCAA